MRKNKAVALLVAAAVSASFLTVPITANAAAMTYDNVYDMEISDLQSFVNNYDDADPNSMVVEDPLDSSNHVWATKKSSNGKNGILTADMDFPNTKYLQIEFEIMQQNRVEFSTYLYDGKTWNSGVQFAVLSAGGSLNCQTVQGMQLELSKWYCIKAVVDIENAEYMLWAREKGSSEWRYLAEYDGKIKGQTLTSEEGFRLRLGSENGFTFLDNVKLSGVDSYDKSIIYDFNDVQTKENQLYFNFGNNCSSGIKWSPALFDSSQVLKAEMNVSSGIQPYTADRVPDMDMVQIETRLGFDSRNSALELAPNENLPMQFGIIPVFEDNTGNKDLNGWRPRTNGIIFENTRNINIEGKSYNKEPGTDTVNGYNLSDGKLYTAGYIYDKINKVFKAYFITNNGETIIKDLSSISNRNGDLIANGTRNLAGVQLWLYGNESFPTGKGYYDYLHINEPKEFKKTGVHIFGNSKDMSLIPQIKIDYSNIIDPECLADASVYFTPEGESADTSKIDAQLSTYNGKTLVVTTSEPLESTRRYVMTVCANSIKDLFGRSAGAVETTFTTGSEIRIDGITLEGGTLIDGENTAQLTLGSNDGQSHNVMLIAGIYDKTSNKLLSAQTTPSTITAQSKKFEITFNTAGYTNYKVKIFVWSGFDTMIPYVDAAEFES